VLAALRGRFRECAASARPLLTAYYRSRGCGARDDRTQRFRARGARGCTRASTGLVATRMREVKGMTEEDALSYALGVSSACAAWRRKMSFRKAP